MVQGSGGRKLRAMSYTPGRKRRGLSVVEVLVALMLVTVGLLGIAGSSTLTVRVVGDATRERAAARRAADRLAQLQSAGCVTAASGTAGDVTGNSPGMLRERWIVINDGMGRTELVDSVRWNTARGERTFTLTSALLC